MAKGDKEGKDSIHLKNGNLPAWLRPGTKRESGNR